jgi:TonB-dependent SusC/RagA subfamily outer membrane receptor
MTLSVLRRSVLIGTFSILAATTLASAQGITGTVRGRVIQQGGIGIPDAQVSIAGTRVGVVSGPNGEFVLAAVPAGTRTIVVRRIGFQPAQRAVEVIGGETATVEIAMEVSAVNLSEVVVTGTATPTERRKVGTSIASVDSTLISRAQATTVDQALQGKVAGAQITQNSGGPGGGGMTVRLRGTNSFISGSDPLYIVDGIIIDNGSAQLADLGIRSNPQNRLADLNPNDIERVEIIRGAAAAALYGSRANNGVVQIFTKRGALGKPRYTLNTRVSNSALREQQPFNFYPYDVNGLPIARYNYQDDIFTTARGVENNFSVEGGSEATKYFLSANSTVEDGIMRSTSSRRTGARLNLQQQLSQRLIANVTSNYVTTNNSLQAFGEQNDYGIMGSLFFAPTSVDFRPKNGVYPLPPALGTNPLLAIDRIKNPQRIDRFIGSTKLTWNPRTRLLFDYTIGVDNTSFDQGQYVPRNSVLGTGILATDCAVGGAVNRRREPGCRRQLHVADGRRPGLPHHGGHELHAAEGARDDRYLQQPRPGWRARWRRVELHRGPDVRGAADARLLSPAGSGVGGQAVPHRCSAVRRVLHVRAQGALADLPQAVCIIRGHRQQARRREQPAAAERHWLGGKPAESRERVLAVHRISAEPVREPRRLRQRLCLRQSIAA